MVWDVEWSIYLKFLLGCLWRPILYLKKTKWRTAHPEGVAYPTSTSMGPISAGRGRVISGRLANRCGSRFRTNTKLLPGVTGPISAPSDYLCTVFDDVILACAGAAETMSPPPPTPTPRKRPHGKTFNLYRLLRFSPCVCKVLPEYAICRSNRNIFTCHG